MRAVETEAPPAGQADGGADNEFEGAVGTDYSTAAEVPEGEYSAHFLDHATRYISQNPKAVLRFALAGDYAGIELYAYRNCWIQGTAKQGGRFRLSGRKAKLYRELLMVAQDRGITPQSRPDRISVEPLRSDELLRVRVRIIDSDSDGDPLPDSECYSVIDKILGTDAGAESRASGATASVGPSAAASAGVSATARAGVSVSARAGAGAGAGAGASKETPHPARECASQANPMDNQGAPNDAPMPDDFELPDSWKEEAREDGLIEVDKAARKFVNHYASTGATRHNWRAAWRKWYAEDIDKQPEEPFWGDTPLPSSIDNESPV